MCPVFPNAPPARVLNAGPEGPWVPDGLYATRHAWTSTEEVENRNQFFVDEVGNSATAINITTHSAGADTIVIIFPVQLDRYGSLP